MSLVVGSEPLRRERRVRRRSRKWPGMVGLPGLASARAGMAGAGRPSRRRVRGALLLALSHTHSVPPGMGEATNLYSGTYSKGLTLSLQMRSFFFQPKGGAPMTWKLFRVLACLGVMTISLWAAKSQAAEVATPTCSSMLETSCSPNGATTSCTLPSGNTGSCECYHGTWWCGSGAEQ